MGTPDASDKDSYESIVEILMDCEKKNLVEEVIESNGPENNFISPEASTFLSVYEKKAGAQPIDKVMGELQHFTIFQSVSECQNDIPNFEAFLDKAPSSLM